MGDEYVIYIEDSSEPIVLSYLKDMHIPRERIGINAVYLITIPSNNTGILERIKNTPGVIECTPNDVISIVGTDIEHKTISSGDINTTNKDDAITTVEDTAVSEPIQATSGNPVLCSVKLYQFLGMILFMELIMVVIWAIVYQSAI